MKPIDSQNFDESIAFKAVLTIPDSKVVKYDEFVSYLDKNQLTPIGQIHGLSIYRCAELLDGNQSYLVDERPGESTSLSSVEFSVVDNYLVASGRNTKSNTGRESYLFPLEVINQVLTSLELQSLTPSELRLSVQLLAGMSLQDAALADHVSIETKRSQIKSIMSKLGASRQIDVVRLLLPELTLLADVRNWDSDGQRLFNEYANTYLPERVRCQHVFDAKGKSVRLIDYGPQQGTPVLMLHSMIFPDITEADIDFAYRHNRRLIWPVRPGLFQSSAKVVSSQQYSRETLEGIEIAWEQLCGKPVSVIAMVSSAWHATAFAKAHPSKVKDICYAATCFSAGKYENNLMYFGSSIAELCGRNAWLMTKTVDFMKNRVEDISIFKKTFFTVFKNSEEDTKVLEREFSAPNFGKRLKLAFADSPESVKHDYFSQIHFSWESVKSLQMPIHFIHGQDDSIHKLCDLQRLASGQGNVPVTTLEDSGHILQYEHFHALLRLALNLEEKQTLSPRSFS